MGKNWRVKMGIDGPKKNRPMEEAMMAQGMERMALLAMKASRHACRRK